LRERHRKNKDDGRVLTIPSMEWKSKESEKRGIPGPDSLSLSLSLSLSEQQNEKRRRQRNTPKTLNAFSFSSFVSQLSSCS
jgi:hypothetical protein